MSRIKIILVAAVLAVVGCLVGAASHDGSKTSDTVRNDAVNQRLQHQLGRFESHSDNDDLNSWPVLLQPPGVQYGRVSKHQKKHTSHLNPENEAMHLHRGRKSIRAEKHGLYSTKSRRYHKRSRKFGNFLVAKKNNATKPKHSHHMNSNSSLKHSPIPHLNSRNQRKRIPIGLRKRKDKQVKSHQRSKEIVPNRGGHLTGVTNADIPELQGFVLEDYSGEDSKEQQGIEVIRVGTTTASPKNIEDLTIGVEKFDDFDLTVLDVPSLSNYPQFVHSSKVSNLKPLVFEKKSHDYTKTKKKSVTPFIIVKEIVNITGGYQHSFSSHTREDDVTRYHSKARKGRQGKGAHQRQHTKGRYHSSRKQKAVDRLAEKLLSDLQSAKQVIKSRKRRDEGKTIWRYFL